MITNTSGEYNVAIGYQADVTSGTLSNATAIGYNAKVGASNNLILGGTGASAVKVGIGTNTATSRFDVTETTTSDNGIHFLNTNAAGGNVGVELRSAYASAQQYIDFTTGCIQINEPGIIVSLHTKFYSCTF